VAGGGRGEEACGRSGVLMEGRENGGEGGHFCGRGGESRGRLKGGEVGGPGP